MCRRGCVPTIVQWQHGWLSSFDFIVAELGDPIHGVDSATADLCCCSNLIAQAARRSGKLKRMFLFWLLAQH